MENFINPIKSFLFEQVVLEMNLDMKFHKTSNEMKSLEIAKNSEIIQEFRKTNWVLKNY